MLLMSQEKYKKGKIRTSSEWVEGIKDFGGKNETKAKRKNIYYEAYRRKEEMKESLDSE